MSDVHRKSTTELLSQIPNMKAEDISELEARLKEAKETTAEFIRKYPLTSVAIAAGIGYYVAKLFYKRR